MGDDDVATVTIERRFFETLVRRAQLHASDVPISQSLPTDAITVSRVDHETLQRTARQYANLRQNLLRGGVGEDTIHLLSQDDTAIQDGTAAPGPTTLHDEPRSATQHKAALAQSPRSTHSVLGRRPLASVSDGHNIHQENCAPGRYPEQDWSEVDAAQDDISCPGDTPGDETNSPFANGIPPSGGRANLDRQCTRTIQLLNLPDGASHADITSVVRGGMLLDVFVRAHDRSATISFLHAADARSFFDHCRRHDLYVKHKRVEVRWSERQFILAGHVASKIGIGATRNLVVRRCDPRITEASVREDLEHIHNLVVIKVAFVGGSCYISTNSVHNAMFARTCMMSRFKFKGSKIDWDVDECAAPLGRTNPLKGRKEPPLPRKPANAIGNRFQLLNIDDEDDDEATPDFPRAKEAVGIIA